MAVVAGGAYLLWARGGEDGEEEAEETLPREMILDLFSELTKQMPGKMAPLMQQLEAVRAQNPGVNEAELMAFVSQHFEKTLLEAQAKLFAEYGVEEADVDEATHFYMGENDQEVLTLVNEFRQLYVQFGGTVEVELPSDLTEQVMLAAFDDYAEARDKANATIIAELQRSQGQMSEAQHRVLMAHAQTLMNAALKKHGIDALVWQTAVKKFLESSAAFKAKFDEDTAEQEEKMKKLQGGRA